MDAKIIEDEEKKNEIDDCRKYASVKIFSNFKRIDVESIYFIDGYLKAITKLLDPQKIIPNEIKFIILKFAENTFVIGCGYSEYFGIDSIKIDNIVKCASFYEHSLFVDIKGNVYGVGKNDYYQLGLKHNDYVEVPQLISINANIVEVAAGSDHGILLCVQGVIYTVGDNKCNQCAQGNKEYIKSPTKCEYFISMTVVKISAGGWHSGCITSDNNVYLFGWNVEGQCGVGKEIENAKIPQKMNFCAKSVKCSFEHTLVISTNKQLYACGANQFGQIGNNARKNQFGLIQINLPCAVIDADCGSDHSLCILENGAAYSWGHGECGQLGHEDENNKLVPTQIKFKNIKFKKCVAGLYNSCLIDEDDNFYCFGDNEHGQLCVGDSNDKNIPTKIEKKKVVDISIGNVYSFLLFGEEQKKQPDSTSKVDP